MSITVGVPSTLSVKSITIGWTEKTLKIIIPTLPPKEELKIDFIRVGHYQSSFGRLRGTGGKYKIVSLQSHETKRELATWGMFILIAITGLSSVLWLNAL